VDNRTLTSPIKRILLYLIIAIKAVVVAACSRPLPVSVPLPAVVIALVPCPSASPSVRRRLPLSSLPPPPPSPSRRRLRHPVNLRRPAPSQSLLPPSRLRRRRRRRRQSLLFGRSTSSHTEESIWNKVKAEKVYFYIYGTTFRKTNLAEIFSEARSGTIAHKNKKRITAGTHSDHLDRA